MLTVWSVVSVVVVIVVIIVPFELQNIKAAANRKCHLHRLHSTPVYTVYTCRVDSVLYIYHLIFLISKSGFFIKDPAQESSQAPFTTTKASYRAATMNTHFLALQCCFINRRKPKFRIHSVESNVRAGSSQFLVGLIMRIYTH